MYLYRMFMNWKKRFHPHIFFSEDDLRYLSEFFFSVEVGKFNGDGEPGIVGPSAMVQTLIAEFWEYMKEIK